MDLKSSLKSVKDQMNVFSVKLAFGSLSYEHPGSWIELFFPRGRCSNVLPWRVHKSAVMAQTRTRQTLLLKGK